MARSARKTARTAPNPAQRVHTVVRRLARQPQACLDAGAPSDHLPPCVYAVLTTSPGERPRKHWRGVYGYVAHTPRRSKWRVSPSIADILPSTGGTRIRHYAAGHHSPPPPPVHMVVCAFVRVRVSAPSRGPDDADAALPVAAARWNSLTRRSGAEIQSLRLPVSMA